VADGPPTALVLVPKSVATQWESEFGKWLLDQCGNQAASNPRNLRWQKFPDAGALKRSHSGDGRGGGLEQQRLQALRRWRREGGVMVMVHDTYRSVLSSAKNDGAERQARAAAQTAAAAGSASEAYGGTNGEAVAAFNAAVVAAQAARAAADAAGQERERELAEYRRLLQDPGPDVLVIDEAHVIKNEKNQLRAVLAGVRTMRRVLLTGTPLQNNLREYFHMVDYASPGLLSSPLLFSLLLFSSLLTWWTTRRQASSATSTPSRGCTRAPSPTASSGTARTTTSRARKGQRRGARCVRATSGTLPAHLPDTP